MVAADLANISANPILLASCHEYRILYGDAGHRTKGLTALPSTPEDEKAVYPATMPREVYIGRCRPLRTIIIIISFE